MKISVVMATFNGAKYLREQMDSILSQTLKPDEIVVADDCSTDGTWDIIQEYCDQYQGLFVAYQNERRLGPHQSFKEAFKHASGDIIAPSDQDDIWLPEKLERSTKVLLESGKDLCFMQDKVLYEDGSTEDLELEVTPLYETIYRTSLLGHACVFRKSVLKAYSVCPHYGWDDTLGLWCQCHDSIIAMDEVGSLWRRHSGVITTAISKHSELVIEDASSRRKVGKAMALLAKGKKSEPIRIVMEQEKLLIDACYLETGNPQLKEYSRLTNHLSKQTLLDMVKGGGLSMRIVSKHMDGYGLVDRVKRLFWAFRQPFVWWYDLQDQKRIGNSEPGYMNR